MTSTVDLADYTAEELEELRGLMTPEEQAEFDLLLMPTLEEIEKDWRTWLRTLFPHLVRGELSFFQIEYMEWLWNALWAKRTGIPLPNGENAFMSVWSRGHAKSSFARIAPIMEAAILGQGYCLYISGNQDQANKHLGSIETLLTSDKVRFYYPQLAAPQVRNTDRGSNKAWNQKMLHMKAVSGYVIQAIGLDVGIRGANIDDMRISLEVPDDIDERDDTVLQSEQKMDKFLHSVLPAKKAGTLFICAQNLVIEHGVINRIVTGNVPALANARISGPHPRVVALNTEKREVNGRQRDIVLEPCEVTWPGNDSMERVQEDIDTYTLPVFKRECQHELLVDRTGLVLSPWDDLIHVITKAEFQSVFGYDEVPARWSKEILHDWAQSKSAYHANVVLKLAVSAQNEPLPGCIFLYDPMSFEENTQADDVAIRILQSIAPKVDVDGTMRTWKEILDAEFGRVRLENFVSNATALIDARRDILAKILPRLVGPLLRKNHYRRLRMSHEAKTQRKVYRRVYGLPFVGVNPRKEGGLEFAIHYLKVYRDRPHPFKPGVMGWTQTYVIVPNDKKERPLALRPDALHDHDLLRYQFSHHRHTAPKLTTTGIIEHGPEKMNDDYTNALQMGMVGGGLVADPLTYSEKIEELIPAETRLEHILQPSPMSLTGRSTMSARGQLSYQLAREVAQAQLAPEQQYDPFETF